MQRSKHPNVDSLHERSHYESAQQILQNIKLKSLSLRKVESELEIELYRCKSRRCKRYCIPTNMVSNLLVDDDKFIRHNFTNKSFRANVPEFVTQRYLMSQTSIFNDKVTKYVPPSYDPASKTVNFVTTAQKYSGNSLKNKIFETSIKSDQTEKARGVSRYKDEVSESHMHSIKIKKHDFQEILNHLSLCYTFQLIEMSSRFRDKDWSGSELPFVDEKADFIFVGGYGYIDGVTECNHINLAAKKYQFIDFSNDEAVEALSHMYSMSHLLDGAQNSGHRSSKKHPIHIISREDSDHSDSSGMLSE